MKILATFLILASLLVLSCGMSDDEQATYEDDRSQVWSEIEEMKSLLKDMDERLSRLEREEYDDSELRSLIDDLQSEVESLRDLVN